MQQKAPTVTSDGSGARRYLSQALVGEDVGGLGGDVRVGVDGLDVAPARQALEELDQRQDTVGGGQAEGLGRPPAGGGQRAQDRALDDSG